MAAELGHFPGRMYVDQLGQAHLNGANLFDAAEVPYPQSVAISNAPAAATVSLVTFQAKDGAGANVANVCALDVWLSDAATGIGLTATTASGAVAAGASGTDLGAITAKKALRVLTDATGKYILSITDAAKTPFVPCATVPAIGKVSAGAALTAGSYG